MPRGRGKSGLSVRQPSIPAVTVTIPVRVMARMPAVPTGVDEKKRRPQENIAFQDSICVERLATQAG